MKKLFTFMAMTALAAAPMFAEEYVQAFSYTNPSQGNINMTNCPAGISGMDIRTKEAVTVNRDAEGFIVLKKDGKVLSQIPAQNAYRLFMFDGFTKGMPFAQSIQISFFMSMDSSPAKEPGNYTVTIPDGFFKTRGGQLVAGAEYSYSIAGSSLSIAPAEGTLSSIKSFTMTFPGNVEFVGKPVTRTDTDPDTGETVTYTINPVELTGETVKDFSTLIGSVITSGNTATISFEKEVTTAGLYWLEIAANSFQYTDNGRNAMNSALSYRYEIAANSDNLPITPDAADETYAKFEPIAFDGKDYAGEPQTQYCYFIINLPKEDAVVRTSMQTPKLYQVKEDGTIDMTTQVARFTILREKGLLRVCDAMNKTVETALAPAAGKYALVVPKQAFSVDGEWNSEMIYYYTIEGSGDASYTVVPTATETVASVKEITVDFEASDVLTWSPGYYGYLTSADGTTEYAFINNIVNPDKINEFEYYSNVKIDGNKMTLSLPYDLNIDGEWILSIPTNALNVNGAPAAVNSIINIDSSLQTAVEEIEAATAEAFDIYTVEGICVARGAEKAAVDALPSGLYIINGKKVLVRK